MSCQLRRTPILFAVPLAMLIALLLTLSVHAQDSVTPLPDATPVPTQSVDQILPNDPQPDPVVEPIISNPEPLAEPVVVNTEETDTPLLDGSPMIPPVEESATIENVAADINPTLDSGEDVIPVDNEPVVEISTNGDPYYTYLGYKHYFMPLAGVCPSVVPPNTCVISLTDTPIMDAITDAISRVASGSVAIFVEGNATYSGDVFIDNNKIKALTGNLVAGSFPVISGGVFVSNLTIPFTLSGFTINGRIAFSNNTGTLTLTDLDVKTDESGTTGISITDQRGAEIDTSTGTSYSTVSITNSAFDDNNSFDTADCDTFCGGLQITTNNAAVTLNGVSASRNHGNGIEIVHPGNLTIKNSVFDSNLPVISNNFDGISLDYPDPKVGLFNLYIENTLVNNNSGFGLQIAAGFIPGSVTIKNFEASGNDNGSGLSFVNQGIITLENVVANGNSGYGAWMQNNEYVRTVSIKNGIFNDNGSSGVGSGVDITTKGTTTLYQITANNNRERGLNILTNGAVALTQITANNNSDGLFVSGLGGFGNVTIIALAGDKNECMGNDDYGVYIQNNGAITLSQVISTDNGISGAYLDNQQNAFVNTVSVTGSDFSRSVSSTGLEIYSLGNITLKDVVSSDNAGSTGRGINIDTKGSVSITNITADNNRSYGLSIDPVLALTTGNVTISATTGKRNSVAHNGGPGLGADQYDGIYIKSLGTISLSKTDISYSGARGAYLDNVDASTAKSVTVTDCSFIMNEGEGLFITSKGVVTLTTVTSQENSRRNTFINSNIWTLNDRIVSDFTQDSWQFAGTTADSASIELDSEEFDAYLILKYYDTVGHVWVTVASDNNSGGGTNARIDLLSLPANATYIIYVLSAVSGQYGHYELSLNDGTNSNILTTYEFDGIHVDDAYITGSVSVKYVGTGKGVLAEQNSGNGLDIHTWGAVTLSNVFANSNNLSGAWIDACQEAGGKCQKISNVTLIGSGSSFNNNNQYGLNVVTAGIVNLANFSASDNGYGNDGTTVYDGVNINNKLNGPTTAPQYGVIFSATYGTIRNITSGNYGDGIHIETYGTVTLGRVNAEDNGKNGMYIESDPIGVTKTVTVTESSLNDNLGSSLTDAGLWIYSHGAITLKGIEANGNTRYGVYADGSAGPGNFLVQAIGTLNGLTANDNGVNGLFVKSQGSVTLSKITANDNDTNGVEIDGTIGISKPVIITTGQFNGNIGTGLLIGLHGAVVITGVTAEENGGNGIDVTTASSLSLTNSRLNFNSGSGIQATANGSVTLSAVTSWFNGWTAGGDGIYLTLSSPHAVSLLNSVFMGNYDSGIDITGMETYVPILTGTMYFGNIRNDGNPNLYLH